MIYKLYTDGGARGNPGPGAIGAVLINDKNEVTYEMSKYLGTCTNNEAEYMGLYHGLKAAKEKKVKKLEIYMDSELVIKQLNGEYKIKNERLKKIFLEIKNLSANFDAISYKHVKREENKRADLLVNEALDKNGF